MPYSLVMLMYCVTGYFSVARHNARSKLDWFDDIKVLQYFFQDHPQPPPIKNLNSLLKFNCF